MGKTKMKNWECECGFPYNHMGMKKCDECGKVKPKNAPVSVHRIYGEVEAESVELS